MRIYTGGIDSGYRPTQTYDFCKPKFKRMIFAIKGAKAVDAPIAPKRFTVQKRSNVRVPLFNIGVNEAKNVIASHVETVSPGPGYMHFPDDPVYDEEYFKQLTAEKRGKDGRWIKTRARNEALDVRVYAYASLHIAGVDLELLSLRGSRLGIVSQATTTRRRRILHKGIRR